MPQVLDYSAAFPGAQAIRAAGYAGAVRYIGFPDRRKCATAGELADFTANGLGMALVYEDTATTWRGGYSAGQVGARRARDHANAIGFPAGRPIYMAIDQDVVIAGEFGLMLDFLRGAASVLGGSACTGVYGEADVIDRARDAGVARYFWQTAAWSRGRRTSAHLFQRVGTVYVGGVACDINDVLADDWGQHTLEDDVSWNDQLPNPDYNATTNPNVPKSFEAGDWLTYANAKAGRAADTAARIEARLAAMAGTLTTNQAALLAAISDRPTQIDLTNDQMQQLLNGMSDASKRGLRELLADVVHQEGSQS